LAACPFCAQPLELLPAASALGFKLIAVDALASSDTAAEQAIALSVPIPTAGRDRRTTP
jgi:hypothetical protein